MLPNCRRKQNTRVSILKGRSVGARSPRTNSSVLTRRTVTNPQGHEQCVRAMRHQEMGSAASHNEDKARQRMARRSKIKRTTYNDQPVRASAVENRIGMRCVWALDHQRRSVSIRLTMTNPQGHEQRVRAMRAKAMGCDAKP